MIEFILYVCRDLYSISTEDQTVAISAALSAMAIVLSAVVSALSVIISSRLASRAQARQLIEMELITRVSKLSQTAFEDMDTSSFRIKCLEAAMLVTRATRNASLLRAHLDGDAQSSQDDFLWWKEELLKLARIYFNE